MGPGALIAEDAGQVEGGKVESFGRYEPRMSAPEKNKPSGNNHLPENADRSNKPADSKKSAPGRGKAGSFATVNQVLNRVMSGLDLDKRLREHTLMSLWPSLIGEPFASRSRPLYIDADCNFVLSVADASVGQELSLMKSQVLGQLTKTGRAVGVEIMGLRLDLKHYHAPSEIVWLGSDMPPLPAPPSAADLEALLLPPADIAELEKLHTQLFGQAGDTDSSSNGADQLKLRIVKVFERELRLRRWQLNSGYPVCARCKNPTARLHPVKEAPGSGDSGICPPCFFGKN